jgi:hypothetical protein
MSYSRAFGHDLNGTPTTAGAAPNHMAMVLGQARRAIVMANPPLHP